ncbi:MAG: asparagine synthase (glutamine-hydrolyzing) [Chlorobi bacterium]|nr:asparagine synthase (glutamine-hydrolyzing) [Chlorobiota bacterium]
MCGIAGFIESSGRKNIENESILNRMLSRIEHRGPDETGLFVTPKACIGNVRLSIIDLSGGQQPMVTADRTKWIAYNGEVFNYLELREELISLGHKFKTKSDTEVVLHLYDEYGEKCLSKLNGQFAFAVYDTVKEELFLARDRVGIRPLYYINTGERLVFGSEIKSVFEYPGVERKLSPKGLHQVFTFWTTLTPDTIFEGVKELSPGNYLKFSKGKIKTEPYWNLNFATGDDLFKGTIDEAAEELRYLFKESVKLRLRADVQVAAYLSGGLDSSITTSFIKEVQPDVLNTFSIGFADKVFDETKYQQEVSKYLDTNHQSITIQDRDIPEMISRVLWHTETPILRTSPLPMMKLSGFVRNNNIKVVITGEGADEVFGGYNIFKETIIRHFWAKDPKSKLRPLLLKKLYPYIPQIANASPAMLRMFFGYRLEDTDSPVYSHLLRWKNNSRILNHLSPEMKQYTYFPDPVKEYEEKIAEVVEGYTPLQKAQFIETNVFMSGYLLSSQGDRMAMGNSVEGRYPFLDHRIIEFASTLPDDFKLKGLNEKYILKHMMKGKLPESVLKRPKQAYRAPVATALMKDKSGMVEEMFSERSLNNAGIFEYESVSKLIKKLRKGVAPSEVENMSVIGILTTQLLYYRFISDFKPLDDEDVKKGVVRN